LAANNDGVTCLSIYFSFSAATVIEVLCRQDAISRAPVTGGEVGWSDRMAIGLAGSAPGLHMPNNLVRDGCCFCNKYKCLLHVMRLESTISSGLRDSRFQHLASASLMSNRISG
jgi:hypothetical protein